MMYVPWVKNSSAKMNEEAKDSSVEYLTAFLSEEKLLLPMAFPTSDSVTKEKPSIKNALKEMISSSI